MIKTICKLFYRMDMFYLIINKKTTFYLKRWALGGGLAYISIYVFTLHICSIHYIYYVYAFFVYTTHTIHYTYYIYNAYGSGCSRTNPSMGPTPQAIEMLKKTRAFEKGKANV